MSKFRKYPPFLLAGIFSVIFIELLISLLIFNQKTINPLKITNYVKPQDIAKYYSPPPTSYPSPSPSPRPLTFAEINSLYGPCANLPVIFYHHIQNMDVAKANGQQNLTVATDIFVKQMQYLKDKGYVTLSTNAITDFFDKSIPVPQGGIIIVFDDGYSDFFVNVLPILRQLGFKALMALPTGLVNNPGYVTWDEVAQAASANIEIVNHTWSHANIATSNTKAIQNEVATAQNELTSRGYNANKIFVYPYGTYNLYDENFLQGQGYTLAFTTTPGSILCAKQRYALPRIRIGNVPLSAYGF